MQRITLFHITFFISIIAIVGCYSKKVMENNEDKLMGMWKLEVMELFDEETNTYKPWKDGMSGYLLYEPTGYMSLHLTTKGYPTTGMKFKNFTDTLSLDKLKYLTQNYNYMGTYGLDIENQIVTHTKLSHSNPNEWGGLSVRAYQFIGDTLVIKPTESENAGLRLKLLKI